MAGALSLVRYSGMVLPRLTVGSAAFSSTDERCVMRLVSQSVCLTDETSAILVRIAIPLSSNGRMLRFERGGARSTRAGGTNLGAAMGLGKVVG